MPSRRARCRERTTGNRSSGSWGSTTTAGFLGRRLMVGQVPLEHFVLVRIQAAQPGLETVERAQSTVAGSETRTAHGGSWTDLSSQTPTREQNMATVGTATEKKDQSTQPKGGEQPKDARK